MLKSFPAKTAVFIFFCAFVTFTVSEIIVRALHLAPNIDTQYSRYISDPILPYKLRPLAAYSGRSASGEFDFEYRHNSAGFRDTEHSPIKEENVFRILGLGDSFTYGSGASFDNTYLFLLEEMLNRRDGSHPEIEIIKAGMPLFSPEPERLFLEHYGVKYSPDLILLGFLPNDVTDTRLGRDFIGVDPSGYLKTYEAKALGPAGQFLYLHSHIARILFKQYVLERLKKKYILKPYDVYRPDGFHEDDWKKVEEEYGRIAKIANSVGAKLVVIHIPQQGFGEDCKSYPAKRLAAFCPGIGAEFIDTLPALEEASKTEPAYYEKDGHCRPAGYRVIAEVLYRELTERKLIP